MNLYYLNNGECFTSDSDLLCIDKSSELYYIEKDDGRYIAWNKNNNSYNSFFGKRQCFVNKLNFYSVMDDSLVLTKNEVYDLTTGELLLETEDVIIKKLSDLLNIKGNQKYIFEKEDVNNFLCDEITKLKTKKKRK